MTYHQQDFCTSCGTKLIIKPLEHEGDIPYCQNCQSFRFPIFNTAVSCLVFDENQDKILMIKQYGMADYILVAGYIAQGDTAEATIRREIKEELNLDVTSITFNQSGYFEPSNTLMLNFAVSVTGQVKPNHEIDDWAWFDKKKARQSILDKSLAKQFLCHYLDK